MWFPFYSFREPCQVCCSVAPISRRLHRIFYTYGPYFRPYNLTSGVALSILMRIEKFSVPVKLNGMTRFVGFAVHGDFVHGSAPMWIHYSRLDLLRNGETMLLVSHSTASAWLVNLG